MYLCPIQGFLWLRIDIEVITGNFIRVLIILALFTQLDAFSQFGKPGIIMIGMR